MGKNADVFFGTELIDRASGERALFKDIIAAAGGAGSGDMLKSVYDPNTVNGDAFDMDNMVEGADTKIMTAQERQDIVDSFSMGNMVETATAKVFTDVERTALAALVAPAQVVNVNDLSHFPAPVGGVITLVAGTTYSISGNVNIGTNRIVFSAGSGLVGTNRFTDFLTYTGTGTLFTADGATHKIEELGIIASSGTVLSLLNGTTNTAVYTNSYIVACTHVGNIADWRTFVNRSFSIVGATGTGMTFSGACGSFSVDNSLYQSINGACIDFGTATFDRIQISSGNRFVLPSPTEIGIAGAAASANINAGGYGIVSGVIFQTVGGGVPVQGITVDDLGWTFRDNVGVEDSHIHGSTQATANTVATTINTQNVWERIQLVTIDASDMERISSPAQATLQFDALDSETIHCAAYISFEKVGGGGADVYEFAVYADRGAGFQIIDANQTASASSSAGNVVQVAAHILTELKEGDQIAAYVRNTDGTADLIVRDFQIAIH